MFTTLNAYLYSPSFTIFLALHNQLAPRGWRLPGCLRFSRSVNSLVGLHGPHPLLDGRLLQASLSERHKFSLLNQQPGPF
jgi:hypothetical protein